MRGRGGGRGGERRGRRRGGREGGRGELTLSSGATTVPRSTLAHDPRISTTTEKQVSNERSERGGGMGVKK